MPITIVSVISFYVPFYVISAFVGPELSVTIGAIISLVAVVIMGRKSSGDIPEEYLLEKKDEEAGAAASAKPQMSVAKAWIPYVLIVIFILGSSKPVSYTHLRCFYLLTEVMFSGSWDTESVITIK